MLLATRGHPKAQAANVHQFIIAPIQEHSRKPDEARDKIVALMGDVPRVELFARQSPPGWDVWGNEVESTVPDFWTKCPEVGAKEVIHALCECSQRLIQIKTKLAFNLTKRQLVCFGIAAMGIPSYLLARSTIGNTAAMF